MTGLTKEQMEREYQQWSLCLSKLHRELDAAGIPRADATVCDDPSCDSKILHRVRALKEKLAAVERERDTARQAHYEVMGWFVKTGIAMGWELGGDLTKLHEFASALRTELERKDAALKELELRAHNHLMTGDMLEEGVNTSIPLAQACQAARAALQPKDKPCQS